MLSPDYLRGAPDSIMGILYGVEDYIIADIARRLKKMGEATSTAEIQRVALQAMGQGTKDINRKVAEILGLAEDEVTRMFDKSSQIATDNQQQALEQIGFKPNKEHTAKLARTAANAAAGDIGNLTRTMGYPAKDGQLTFWQDEYRRVLGMAQMQVASGAVDYNTATRNAIRPFARQNMSVVYPSGRRVSLEAAVRQCVIGGVSEMSKKISEETAETIGADGWEITAHGDCAPDHIDIQGRQYTNKEYAQLNASLERPIGALGCRHMAFPVLIGVQEPVFSRDDLDQMQADNAKGIEYEGVKYTRYEAAQMQRKLEREIRTAKKELIGYDKAGAKDDFTASSSRLRRLRTHYSDFSAKAGLLKQGERTQVAGYGRKMSGKVLFAEAQAKKAYAKQHLASVDAQMALKSPAKGDTLKQTLSFSDRHAADKVLRPETEKLWPKLSTDEKEAAYQYTCSSVAFNRPLRGYDKDWDTFVGVGKVPLNNGGAERYIKGLESAIEKTSVPQDMWAFRGSDQQSLAGLLGVDKSKIIPSNVSKLNKQFAGKEVKDTAFFSTGVAPDAGFNGKVAYEVLVPKGAKGMYAEPFSRYGSTNTTGTWDGIARGSGVGTEAEMILQKGTRFGVIEIKEIGGKVTVIMEVEV